MRTLQLVLVSVLVVNVFAEAPSITGVTAQQRYPWNGKVDISYTVTGDIAAVTLSIEGGAKFNGKSTTIQSAEEIGDKLEKNGVELISENASKDL